MQVKGLRFTVVIRISMKELLENLGVHRCPLRPHLPQLVAQGVLDELVAFGCLALVPDVVHCVVARWPGVQVVGGVIDLRR